MESVQRLKSKYRSAQDRYGCTGSASSDRTMHRYSTLIDTLERGLSPSETSILRSRIDRIQKALDVQREKGQMSPLAYEAINRAIHEGKDA